MIRCKDVITGTKRLKKIIISRMQSQGRIKMQGEYSFFVPLDNREDVSSKVIREKATALDGPRSATEANSTKKCDSFHTKT